MPNNIVKSFAQKSGKSEAEVEKLWNQAKAEAEKKSGVDDVYAYTVGILKKMLSIDEKVMEKTQERRELTKQFIQKVADGQKFDASADLNEIIRLSKEIRYDAALSAVEL